MPRLTQTRTLLYALESALTYEREFLASMQNCHEPEDEAAKTFSRELIAAYKQQQKRLRGEKK